ncbi:MAG: integrase core domain-containing protein, partial [Bacteroidota bacterium]
LRSSLQFHSDRGLSYVCEDFSKLLAEHEISQSMSRKGKCRHKTPAESYFKTLKCELDMPRQHENYQSAKSTLFSIIEIWYNRKRLHSTFDDQTATEAERTLKKRQAG